MKKTPKLRFPEFSGEWEERKCSSIFDKVRNSVDVKKNEKYKQIGIRSHGKGLFYKEEVTGKELGNKRVFWVEPNVFVVNIVFAWERAVARTTENDLGLIASHRFPMYKPKEVILDLDYITYFFKTNKGKSLLELASPGGAGRNKTLGQKEFDNLDIVLPRIEEQKKISEFLSVLDIKINKQQEKVEALEEYKKGIMQKIFSQEIRYKDENGQDYPEWLSCELGSMIKKGKAGGTPKSTNSEYYNGKINFLSIADMSSQGKYIEFTEKTISELGLKNSSSWIVPKNSLIYSIYASVGSVCINKIELATSQAMFSMILKDDYFLEYVYQYLMYFRKNGLNKLIETGTQGNINADTVKKIEINIPKSIKEQKKIVDIFSKIDVKIEKEQEKLKCLKKLKNGLFQQMFV